MRKPDFFIVGAPKCGTTALCDYLNQHPQVYVSANKEPFYFGSDLPGHLDWTQQNYLALFEPAGERTCGEASVWYLYSKSAAQEIRTFNPEARIIIMLRNPVEMAYAMHNQGLYNLTEDIEDFDEAVKATERRSQGLDIPANWVTHATANTAFAVV